MLWVIWFKLQEEHQIFLAQVETSGQMLGRKYVTSQLLAPWMYVSKELLRTPLSIFFNHNGHHFVSLMNYTKIKMGYTLPQNPL